MWRAPKRIIAGTGPLTGMCMQWGGGAGSKGGMSCTLCPHVGCQHSYLRQGVTPCPECDKGTVVLDPVSAPRWRLDCSLCNFLIYLPSNLHAAKVTKEQCQVSHCICSA